MAAPVYKNGAMIKGEVLRLLAGTASLVGRARTKGRKIVNLCSHTGATDPNTANLIANNIGDICWYKYSTTDDELWIATDLAGTWVQVVDTPA